MRRPGPVGIIGRSIIRPMGVSTVRIVLLLVTLFVIAGCDTEGAFLKEQRYEELKAEVRTAEELFEALGPPSVTIPRADGQQVWVYEGVYTQADATRYVPYLDLIAGTNSQTCTRLTVVVDNEDGSLSDWEYKSEKDRDYWAKTDNSCSKKKKDSDAE